MKPGHRLRNIGIGFLYFFVIAGVLGAVTPDPEGGSETAPETTTAADAVTTTADMATDGGTTTAATTAVATTAETTTTEAPTTTTTTVAPAEDGASYEFSGSGNDVTDSFSTEGGFVVLDFQHDGSSNFQVKAVSSNGDEEYLVNHIGNYDGEVAVYLPSEDYRLDITADGSWSADVTQPRFNQQDVEDLPASADGKHAYWLGPFEFEGGEEVTFEIKGDSQAAVWLATTQGEKVDLLHNEIGPYEGSALVTDSGFGLIIIETDSADWRIEIKR
jgi:hypothetical protein